MEAARIFVERIIEPYTGWELLGVGGTLPPSPTSGRICVLYDGQPAALVEPRADRDQQLHFATQLPLEPAISTVQVVFEETNGSRILLTASMREIPHRSLTATAEPRGFFSRVLRNIATGAIVSPTRWHDRLRHWQEKLLKARLRWEHRLLLHRHPPLTPHEAYCLRTNRSESELAAQRRAAARLASQPLISILMPVYQVNPRWFRAAVQSVLAQTYEHWQLCIADDASSRVDLLAEYERLPADRRICLTRRRRNGHICEASNTAAAMATGEFFALLDHDDTLAPDALFEVAQAINKNQNCDLLYSDEDKIDQHGRRYDPQHKPAWSPELLLSYNYINHFTVLRRSVFERVGGFRPGYEGSQDHDLLLRATELTDRIVHIPRILYHWRALPSSTAAAASVKGYVHTSGRRAVEDALVRRGVQATLTVPAFAQRLGLPILALDGPDEGPAVAVIVHGPDELAKRTIQALESSTSYQNCVFVQVEACSAAAINRAAAARAEPWLLIHPAGWKPRNRRWLSQMLAYARLPGVGAVGGRFAGDDEQVSYYFYHEVARNADTLPRGSILVARATFGRLGGLDSVRFNHSLWSNDFCRRLTAAGLRLVRVGDAVFDQTLAQQILNNREESSVRMEDASIISEQRQADAADPIEELAFQRTKAISANPHFLDTETFRLSGDTGLVPCKPVKPLRTLVLAHNLNNPEGAPRYLAEIILGLRSRGAIDPQVLSPGRGAGEQVYRTAAIPLTFLDAPWTSRFQDLQWSPREYQALQQELATVLRRERPEVVIANTLLTFPMVEAAARANVPCVWIIHESYSPEVLSRLCSPFARHRCESAFRLATRIVPASFETAALFRQYDQRHAIRVIHNGISPAGIDDFCRRVDPRAARQKLCLQDAKVHFIAVGTVCERKGQHLLVEAAAQLLQKRSNFMCHLVGMREGVPYATYVRQLAARRGLSGLLNFVSETNDVFTWLRAADVFVCTSRLETFSRAILEAEAFGLPIISTPCAGISEQVAWGWNALKVPQDDPVSLAQAMERLIADAGLRQDMGRRSRARFHLHETLDSMLDQYQAVLQQAVRKSMFLNPVAWQHQRAA